MNKTFVIFLYCNPLQNNSVSFSLLYNSLLPLVLLFIDKINAFMMNRANFLILIIKIIKKKLIYKTSITRLKID